MGFKIAIVGCGQFSKRFMPLYKAHPYVDELVLCDSVPERVAAAAEQFGVERTYTDFDAVLQSDVDAVGIFTQRQLHGPMVIQALKAGKHVVSAVPMATNVADVAEIIRLVQETKLIYMTNETSYYYPNAIYCREKYQAGEFGEFTYAEAYYEHDMKDFYMPFQRSGGENWKRIAGFPPMFYPTHSTSMALCVTGAHATAVSCLGFRDHHEDGIFGEENNDFSNPFSNQTALMRTSDGGCLRINEFRRVVEHEGANMVAMTFKGTNASYTAGVQTLYTTRGGSTEDITDLIECNREAETDGDMADIEDGLKADFYAGTAPTHHTERLPAEYKTLPNGHAGSHQFLTDDFCRAIHTQKMPPNHAWAGAKYCVPGLIAHQSALQNGIMLDVPYFGELPAEFEMIVPDETGAQ